MNALEVQIKALINHRRDVSLKREGDYLIVEVINPTKKWGLHDVSILNLLHYSYREEDNTIILHFWFDAVQEFIISSINEEFSTLDFYKKG